MPETNALDLAWQSYQAAESRGLRREYLAALDHFIAQVAATPAPLRSAWIAQFVRTWACQSPQRPMLRGRLLEAVVLPHLAEQFHQGSASATALLAELRSSTREGSLRAWSELQLPEARALLEAAWQRDPDCIWARERWVRLETDYVRYTLHELPCGVLWGHDGASAAECIQLETRLQQLQHALSAAERAEHETLLARATFHYQAYRRYLAQPERCGYAEFLQRAGEAVPERPTELP